MGPILTFGHPLALHEAALVGKSKERWAGNTAQPGEHLLPSLTTWI